MDGAKLLVALCTSLIAMQTQAQTSQTEMRRPLSFKAARTNNTITKKLPKKIEYTPQKISLVIPSFVVHGVKPGNNASTEMPRKMDETGRSVVTPGIGLEYKSETGFLAVGAVIKDCYDNLAGTLQLGEQFEITDHVNWGLTLGVYARQTPYSCETVREGRTVYMDCQELDNFSWKFMTTVNGQSVDIIPLPFLHLSVALYKSPTIQVDLKLMSNFILNEVGFGIPF